MKKITSLNCLFNIDKVLSTEGSTFLRSSFCYASFSSMVAFHNIFFRVLNEYSRYYNLPGVLVNHKKRSLAPAGLMVAGLAIYIVMRLQIDVSV